MEHHFFVYLERRAFSIHQAWFRAGRLFERCNTMINNDALWGFFKGHSK